MRTKTRTADGGEIGLHEEILLAREVRHQKDRGVYVAASQDVQPLCLMTALLHRTAVCSVMGDIGAVWADQYTAVHEHSQPLKPVCT